MSRCRRCGRVLKREPWASKGIGKICSQKDNINSQKSDNGDSDIIVPYDGGDIWIERLAAPTYGNDGELKIAVHTCSGIKTNVQRTVYRHSPTGFNFGYGGSGPADLALNICLMFCKNPKEAESFYQEFKWQFCGNETDGKLIIPRVEIENFISEKRKAVTA